MPSITDSVIRIAVLALLAVACAQVIAPFVSLLLWATILTISLQPWHATLTKRLRGRRGLAAGCLVTAGLLLVGTPTILLGTSFATHAETAYAKLHGDGLSIPEPDPAVAAWPVVGPRVYATWQAIAGDLPGYLREHKTQLQQAAKTLLQTAASTAGSVALFLAALIVAAIMLTYAESMRGGIDRLLVRLTDPVRGARLRTLAASTVRSVAAGVIGVAFLQALLLGVGFLLAGLPAAGVLAFVALLLGIVQLPMLVLTLPVIAYIWWGGDGSTAGNIVFTVFLLVAGMIDNVLKPLLLGRGVEAPMPVILIGALGGMVTNGILGLFVGAVLLAIAYQLVLEWSAPPPAADTSQPGQTGEN